MLRNAQKELVADFGIGARVLVSCQKGIIVRACTARPGEREKRSARDTITSASVAPVIDEKSAREEIGGWMGVSRS